MIQNAMQEELGQFERNQVWFLTPRPKDHLDRDKMGV